MRKLWPSTAGENTVWLEEYHEHSGERLPRLRESKG